MPSGSNNDDDYARLTAEVYGLLLVAPGSSSQNRDETGRSDHSTENHDLKDSNNDQTHTVDIASRTTERPSSSSCLLRVNDRLHLLEEIGRQTENTAEELVCILEAPGRRNDPREESTVHQDNFPPGQRLSYYYFNAIRGLTDSVWNLALTASKPADLSAAKEVEEDAEEAEEEEDKEEDTEGELSGDRAARRLQDWARRQKIRIRTSRETGDHVSRSCCWS